MKNKVNILILMMLVYPLSSKVGYSNPSSHNQYPNEQVSYSFDDDYPLSAIALTNFKRLNVYKQIINKLIEKNNVKSIQQEKECLKIELRVLQNLEKELKVNPFYKIYIL